MPATIWAETSPWIVNGFVLARVSWEKQGREKRSRKETEYRKQKTGVRGSIGIFGAADEGHFDCSLEETEEGFLLLFHTTDFLDLMAAERAQPQQLAPATA